MDAAFGENRAPGENGGFTISSKTWTAKSAFCLGVVLGLGGLTAICVDGPVACLFSPLQVPPAGKSDTSDAPSPSASPAGGKTYDRNCGRGGGDSVAPSGGRPFKVPSELKRLLTWSEGFGHGLGVVLLAGLLYQLDPNRRRQLLRPFVMALGSGAAADAMKLLIGRTRPRAFDLAQPIWESFTGLFPVGLGGSAGQSFPSAHAATAFGWALGLGWLYPRGRWSFLGLAFLVLCQRVESLAHFVSDALIGASVGCMVGALFLPNGWLSRPLDRWEKHSGKSCPVHPPPQEAKG